MREAWSQWKWSFTVLIWFFISFFFMSRTRLWVFWRYTERSTAGAGLFSEGTPAPMPSHTMASSWAVPWARLVPRAGRGREIWWVLDTLIGHRAQKNWQQPVSDIICWFCIIKNPKCTDFTVFETVCMASDYSVLNSTHAVKIRHRETPSTKCLIKLCLYPSMQRERQVEQKSCFL